MNFWKGSNKLKMLNNSTAWTRVVIILLVWLIPIQSMHSLNAIATTTTSTVAESTPKPNTSQSKQSKVLAPRMWLWRARVCVASLPNRCLCLFRRLLYLRLFNFQIFTSRSDKKGNGKNSFTHTQNEHNIMLYYSRFLSLHMFYRLKFNLLSSVSQWGEKCCCCAKK